MEDSETTGLIEHPTTFNYAAICAAFELKDQPKILLIGYKERPDCEPQVKLPAGRFQAQDLISAVESFLQSKDGRIPSLEYFCMTVDNLNRKYLSAVETAKNIAEQNFFFNDFTKKILEEFQHCCLNTINEVEFKQIIIQTHENTAIHELQEETRAKFIGKLCVSSVATKDGEHYKIGFVTTDLEAPNSYVGSPDRKVIKSYWSEIHKNTEKTLFVGHQYNFQEGIREAIKLVIHPKVSVLEPFLTAVQ